MDTSYADPFVLDVDAAITAVDPLVFVHEDLLSQPQWMSPNDHDGYVALMLEPLANAVVKVEPMETPPLRRSARIAATPRRSFVSVDPPAPSSTVGLTSGEDDDDDDEDDVEMVEDVPDDKKERRREQVRKASSRRREKLKNEDIFLNQRLEELDEDERILNEFFFHLAPRRPPFM